MNAGHNRLFVAGGVIFALFAIASILLGDINAIAHLFFYLMLGGGLLALMAPRQGFVVLLISCAYVDLLKRLMVVSGRMSMSDLYYVLGFSPVLLGIVIVSLVARGAAGRIAMNRGHVRLLVTSGALILFTSALAYLGGDKGLGKLMQSVANGGFYAALIFVVPVLFQTTGEVLRLLRTVMWIYVPVAVYGMIQKVYGFQDFEVQYLMSGLSIEVKQLFTDRVRAFSTLNSPTSLGAISAVFSVLPLFLANTRNRAGERFLGMPIAIILTGLFLGATLASTSRTALVVVVLMSVGVVCFQSRRGTLAYYGVGGGAFVILLLSAGFLLNHIEGATSYLVTQFGGVVNQEAIDLNTFSDRLKGFSSVLLNPDAYTLFGYGGERGGDPLDPLYNHDLLSNVLVRYGAVPLMTMVVFVSGCLIRTHQLVLAIKDTGKRRLGAGMLAMVLSLIAISITSGNVLGIFPVNTLFWLGISCAIVVLGDGGGNRVRNQEARVIRPSVTSATPQWRPVNQLER
jgi:hypothetical protein